MYTFLFDILPDTGHVRITLQLASLLHQKGHEVYYTDSSDSVFTSGLLARGIGRVLYPEDFRWFTPNLVLLDYELKEKVAFYREHHIKHVFIAMQLLSNVIENQTGAPIVYLPPSADAILPSHIQKDDLSDWLPMVKEKNEDHIIIIGLLEEGEHSPKLDDFYEVIKKSCIMNAQYRIILLTNSKENIETLFSLPNNMTICRSIDLPSTLPFCDVALIAGDLNTMIEGIQANIPAVVYPVSGKAEHNHRIRQYVKQGLGVYSETKRMTPEVLEQQIAEVIRGREGVREKLQITRSTFENENLRLERVIERLIKILIQKE